MGYNNITSMKENSKFMKYGDYIILMGTTSNTRFGKLNGFVSAVGFTDKRVFFQKVPNEALDKAIKQSFGLGLSKEEVSNPLSFITNYNELVFQVWPRLNFESHKEYRKTIKERDQLKQRLQDLQEEADDQKQRAASPVKKKRSHQSQTKVQPMPEIDTEEVKANENLKERILLESVENKLKILRDKILQERRLNEKQIDYFIGEKVSYGNDVQLLHAQSNMYLNGKILASEAEKSAYMFELSDSFSGGMIFRFMPKFKLRQIGEPIQYNDMIIIQNSKLNCFINFSVDLPIELDRVVKKTKNQSLLPITEINFNGEMTPRYEAFLSLFSDTTWQIIRHSKGQQIEDDHELNIKGGEIVRLKHTELDELLTADVGYTQELPELFTRTYTGDYEEEQFTLAQLWQIELDTAFGRGRYLHYQAKGDQSNYYFRVRHLLSGRLLGADEITVNGQKKSTLVLLKNEEISKNQKYDLATRIEFISTIEADHFNLRSNNCYQICVGDKFLRMMTNDKSFDGYQNYRIKKPIVIEGYYKQLVESELGVDRKALELSKQCSDEDAFWIEKIDDELKKDIGYLLSTSPHIYRFVQLLMEKDTKQLTPEYMKTLLKTLNQLTYFLTDTPLTEPKPKDFPIATRQRMLKNCYLLDYLTQILYYPYKNELIKDATISQDLNRIIDSTYRLIKMTIKEYRPNELYMSQWIELLMNQAMNKDSSPEAGDTLTELIDNNRFVLENKISKETIDKFVVELVKTKDVKYINLLKALINCDGEAMVGNQSEISNKILKNGDTADLIPELEFDGKSVLLDKIPLQQFKMHSFEMDNLTSYNYFVTLIQFLSDLCLDKNFIAITPLQVIFRFDMCKFIMTNLDYDDDLRSAFARLTLTLWIEGKQLQKIQLPNFVRTWDEIGEDRKVDVISSRDDLSLFTELKLFINDHIQRQVEKGFQRVYHKDQNELTFVILQICETFLHYGFYQNVGELTQLAKPLVGYLNSSNDVTTKEEEVAKRHELNLLSQSRLDVRRMSRIGGGGSKMQGFKSRYGDNDENALLCESRALICKNLMFVHKLATDMKATLFLQDFKKNYSEDDPPTKKPVQKNAFSFLPLSLNDLNPFNLFKSEVDSDPDLEPLKWIDAILKRSEYDTLDENREYLVAIIMDLLMYENVGLVSNAFTLLNDLYQNKIGLVSYLKDIQIIDDPDKMVLLEEVREIKKNLQISIDNSENWWGLDNPVAIQECTKVQQQVERLKEIVVKGVNAGLHKSVSERNSARSRSNDLEDQKEEDLLLERPHKHKYAIKEHPEFQFGILDSKLSQTIKPEFQKMMRNLHIYEPLLSLINFDLSSLEQKKETTHSTLLMRTIYQFLAHFCFENSLHKQLFKQNVKQFRQHLAINKDYLAHLVLQEIFRNNRTILMNQKKLKKVIRKICELMEASTPQDPLKIFLLDSLTIYMRVDGRVLKTNQTAILNELGLHDKLLYLLENVNEFDDFLKSAKKLTENFEKVLRDPEPVDPEVVIPQDISYFLVLLNVMSTAAEDKNPAAESRCQSYFGLRKIRRILKRSKGCWPLRKGMVQFFYDVFLDTEKELEDSQEQVIKIVREMVEDIWYWSENYEELANSAVQMVTFQEVVEGKLFINDYLNNVVIPSLSLIIKYLPFQEVEIFGSLVNSIYKFAGCQSQTLIFNMSKLLIQIENSKKISREIHFLALKQEMPIIMQSMIKNIIVQGQSVTAQKRTHRVQALVQDKGVNGRFVERLERLTQHDYFNKQVEEEIEDMVHQVACIDKLTSSQLKTVRITFDQILTQLIKLTDPKEDPLPVDLIMVSMKIFRKIIEKENLDMVTPAADWATDDYSLYVKKIEEKQNELVRLGFTEIIYDMVAMDVIQDLKNEAVLVGISLLLAGNLKAQQAFYDHLQADMKNDFIESIKALIDANFQQVKKYSDRLIRTRELKIKAREKQKSRTKDHEDEEELQKASAIQKSPQMPIQFSQREQPNKYKPDSNLYEEKLLRDTKRVFRFLQLFCEGHNLDMQNYLRQQTQDGQVNGKSVNIINYTSLKFGTILKSLCYENFDLVSQILDFLIESVQGPCPENQESLTSSKIVDFCGELIQMFSNEYEYEKRGFQDHQEKVNSLVSQSTKLLLSLIEGNKTLQISKYLATNLELDFIKKRLVDIYVRFVTTKLQLPANTETYKVNAKMYEKVDFYEGEISDGFDIYLLLVSLADKLQDAPENVITDLLRDEDDDEVTQGAMEFYRSNTASVEVDFNKSLLRVFFPVAPTCRNLSKDSRENLMTNVKRDSPNDKINGLVNESTIMFTEMHHMSFLQKLPFYFTAGRLNFFRDLSTLLALLINLILLSGLERKLDKNKSYILLGDIQGVIPTEEMITVLGLMQLVTSSLMLTFWIIINTPVILTRQWNNFVEQYRVQVDEKIEDEIYDVNKDPSRYTTRQVVYLFKTKGPYSQFFKLKGAMHLGSPFAKLLYYIKSAIFLCSDPKFTYMFFYIVVSIIAVVQSEILYCFHLLDIINRSPLLLNVVHSVTGNFRSLALTLLLMAFVIYIYALLGYYFLNDNFFVEEEDACASVFQCYLTSVQFGMRNGGGIAESLKIISYEKNYQTTYWIRFVYDVSFFTIITVIFLNIIFGIIIDTFAGLRDEKTAMSEDMNTKCYICGLDRYEFEKNADGFKNHIERDHQLWNYLFYMHYLDNKESTEYNGIESFVTSMLDRYDIGWFPIMKAISLGEMDEEDGLATKIKEPVEEMKAKLAEIQTILMGMSK